MQPRHPLFHKSKLLCARAVTGIIFCRETVQALRKACQSIIQRKLGKMEPANQHIRLEPSDDIQNPFVRTPAEQNPRSALLNKQVLIMAEILG